MDSSGSNERRYFSIPISNQKEGESLVLKLITEDQFSDPDLYVSTKESHPDSPGNSEIMCASEGSDLCSVPSEMLRNGGTVYAGVVCKSFCQFSVRAELRGKIQL